MSNFVHLHGHSMFSLLDGYGKPAEYVNRAAELKQPAVAITDHGRLSASYQLWKTASAASIVPIVGMEAYFNPLGRQHKEPVNLGPDQKLIGGSGAFTHLTLLARTATGVRNLFRMQAEGYMTGFYRQPRVDLELLSQHSEGLICLTGCAGGLVSTYLRLGMIEDAKKHLYELKDIFQEHLYTEVMYHGIDEPDLNELQLNVELMQLAKEISAPLVLTNDFHYALPEEASVHDALLCVQTNAKVSDEKRFRFNGEYTYHLATAEEMELRANLSGIPMSALHSTMEIADSVESYDAVFKHQLRMPKWHGHGRGVPAELELDSQVRAWLIKTDAPPQHLERANYELDTITSLGFADYFLVVADVVQQARAQGIRVGPARGSAGGSLVAYALGITSLDPIPSGLLFERFINPERVGLPDIDIDIQEDRRDEVLAIAREKYGEDCVAQLGTNGTFAAKGSLKDAARVLGYSYRVGEEHTWQLPKPKQGFQPTLADYFGEKDDIYELALGLEGRVKTEGVHPAAVIISPEPLRDLIPLRRQGGKGPFVAALTMDEIEALGFVKTDFLGLRTLKVIDDCLQMLPARGDNRAFPILPNSPNECNDPETYELLSRGDSTGVFQLDGSGMRGLLRQVVPDSFADISAVLALYRPGPMGVKADRDYALRKHGRQDIRYPHSELEEALAPILSETYGLIVYQEQVLDVLAAVGDYTYGTAEMIFNAMRKKLPEKMAQAYPDFSERMKRKGYSVDATAALWEVLIPFSAYSFNKSHSSGYGLIAYWTAYLKTHHPKEFMAALLSNETDNDKLAEYLEECSAMGINVLPPDVNDSGVTFTPTEEGIRYGLSAIKGVGKSAISGIQSADKFKSLSDFYNRAPKGALNSKVLGALIRAGALDALSPSREAHVEVYEKLAERARAAREAKKTGQRGVVKARYSVPQDAKISLSKRRQWERETIGVELSAGTVYLKPTEPLQPAELEWIRSVVASYPGRSRCVLDLTLTTVDTGMMVNLTRAKSTLLKLGKIVVEERL